MWRSSCECHEEQTPLKSWRIDLTYMIIRCQSSSKQRTGLITALLAIIIRSPDTPLWQEIQIKPPDVLCRGTWTAGHETTQTVHIHHSQLHTTIRNILLMPNVQGVVCAHSWLIRLQVCRGQLSRQWTLLSVAMVPLIYNNWEAVLMRWRGCTHVHPWKMAYRYRGYKPRGIPSPKLLPQVTVSTDKRGH